MSKVHTEQGGRKTAWFITYLSVRNGRGKNATRLQVRSKEKLSNYERSEAWEQVIQESY